MAAVVRKSDPELDAVGFIDHCQGLLAYVAIPRYVEFVDDLPVTENGKVCKPVLRERGVTSDRWDREVAGYALVRAPSAGH